MKKVVVWLAVPLALILVAGGAWLAVGPLKLATIFGTTSASSNTQVINSITREEQVALLSLGIQGLATRSGTQTFMGVQIPGSEKASFVQYSFNAKLGLNGKDVKIVQSGDKHYVVTLPRFIFIGYSNPSFKTVDEKGGILSFATPDVDPAELITSVLNDDAQAQYISNNTEILRDQAKFFYSSIISGVDPESTATFEFAD